MKNVIKDCYRHRGNEMYFEVCLCLFVAFLPMGRGLDAFFLALLVLSWFFQSTWIEKWQNLKKHKVSLVLILGLYSLIWFGMLYTDDIKTALGRAERSSALLILPIVIFSLDKGFFHLKNIFYALGIGLFVVMMISWASIISDILSKPWPLRQAQYFFEWIYTDDNLLRVVDVHPGYFVLFLVLFLAVLIYSSIFRDFRRKKIVYISTLFLFLLFLVETSSRIGFISLILILAIESIRKADRKRLWLNLAIIFILLLIATQFDYLQSKFEKLINSDGTITFERYHRWKAIFEVFETNASWIFGVGSGDIHQIYRQAYEQGNFTLGLRESYNAHNQYLELLVGTGIVGLALYLGVLFNFIRETKLHNMALAFFILILLFSFSESFLVRSKGVFFFAFFYCLFIVKYSIKDD